MAQRRDGKEEEMGEEEKEMTHAEMFLDASIQLWLTDMRDKGYGTLEEITQMVIDKKLILFESYPQKEETA